MNILARAPRFIAKVNAVSAMKLSTVASQTIQITFVDREGARAKVNALVGQTLFDVARQYKVDLEGTCDGTGSKTEAVRTTKWNEYIYGEGPLCFQCHVQIPVAFQHLLPFMSEHEKSGLEEVWEEEYQERTSRLACQIVLEPKHDGLVVLVPDAPPTDLI